VGADSQLRALFAASSRSRRSIAEQLAAESIQWRFNPPAAPHFGGIWEAAVKSLKHHLRRVLSDATLTYEELSTLLAQVEACLNSRPLQALSNDPRDLTALTPGYFLVGSALTAIPEPSLMDHSTNQLSRWRLLQRIPGRLLGTLGAGVPALSLAPAKIVDPGIRIRRRPIVSHPRRYPITY